MGQGWAGKWGKGEWGKGKGKQHKGKVGESKRRVTSKDSLFHFVIIQTFTFFFKEQ